MLVLWEAAPTAAQAEATASVYLLTGSACKGVPRLVSVHSRGRKEDHETEEEKATPKKGKGTPKKAPAKKGAAKKKEEEEEARV